MTNSSPDAVHQLISWGAREPRLSSFPLSPGPKGGADGSQVMVSVRARKKGKKRKEKKKKSRCEAQVLLFRLFII